VWRALLGTEVEVTPYGLEALGVLRIEKGHVAGGELDGRTTAADLGLGRMVSKTKRFIGASMLGRVALSDPQRCALVGLEPFDGTSFIRAGAQLVEPGARTPPVAMLGHVTSASFSPTLGHPIALALLAGGASRMGSTLVAAAPLFDEAVEVKVVPSAFYDPQGLRMKPA
jgi:sarcosine oxidase subunit alpha